MDAQFILSSLILFVTTILVPILVMDLLAPELEKSAPRQLNYRNKEVWHGLGVIWAIWILGVWIGTIIIGALIATTPLWLMMVNNALPLVMGSCLFGLFDDWIGQKSEHKGLRGHLRELLNLRMTTGTLKLFGIGLLTIFTAALITEPLEANFTTVALVLLKSCVIALSANLINLLDLRPARALKGYSFGVCIASLMMVLFVGKIWNWTSYFALVFASLGPVFAIWRFDAGEQGMLGDAGANAMGAYLGFLFAWSLPIPGLIIVFLLLLILTILSEFVSFSSLINNSKFLRSIDRLGRKDIQ